MNERRPPFGIHLGATNAVIAYVDEYANPVVLPNCDGDRITPSVVEFDGNNVVVGMEAKRNSKLRPEAVVTMVKRFMGDSNWMFEYDGKIYRPEEISSFILRKLVGDAEQQLNEKITDVVMMQTMS